VKIKVIAFDLDDTLLDTTSLLLPVARLPEFFQRISRPLPWMDGALALLTTLKTKYRLALVTQGDPQVQKQKVLSLEAAPHFEHIYYVDLAKAETKKTYFEKILKDFKVSADELLSVGNRRSTDIKWAKKMGAQTCLFNYGEHRFEIASHDDEIPDFQIEKLGELVGTCKL
jgi:putative hydrolase of the HAD superfamily